MSDPQIFNYSVNSIQTQFIHSIHSTNFFTFSISFEVYDPEDFGFYANIVWWFDFEGSGVCLL